MIKPSSFEFKSSLEGDVRRAFMFQFKGSTFTVNNDVLQNDESGWAMKFTIAIPVFSDENSTSTANDDVSSLLVSAVLGGKPTQSETKPTAFMPYDLIIGYDIEARDEDDEKGQLYFELYPISVGGVSDVSSGKREHFKKITSDYVAIWLTRFDSDDDDHAYYKTTPLDMSQFYCLRDSNELGEAFKDDVDYIEKDIHIVDTFIRDITEYYSTLCEI